MAKPSRRGTVMLAIAALLVVVVGGGIVAIRAGAGKSEEARAVGGTGVWTVRNNGVDLYGWRAGKSVVIVDAGMDALGRPIDTLLASLGGATRADVSDLLITHGHGDHYGGAGALPGAHLVAGAEDAGLMSGEEPNPRFLPRFFGWLMGGVAPAQVALALSGRADVQVAGGAAHLTALPFPGHTPGSYLYLWRDVLFTGDAILFDGTQLDAPPDVFTTDPPRARRSIAGLPALLGSAPVRFVCTGHGGCTPTDRTGALIADVAARAAVPEN